FLSPNRSELDVRPLETASEGPAISPSDRLYASAVAAIDQRDYGLALERLQMARERAPDDVRVLNAMAVTYDKLGRFDLSARFYAEAQAVAPGSPVVTANLAYSHLLQRRYDEVRMAAREPEPAVRQYAELMRPAPKTLKVAKASNVTLKRATPALVGQPLMLVDAGGGARDVSVRLAGLGWSVASSVQRTDHVGESRILYPAAHERVAKALANTLPFRTALTVCQDNCERIVLMVGENATWKG
ncbi:MAG TPA: tetratricopeptide repeat protein, partial [Caulobacteraceae bacterium]